MLKKASGEIRLVKSARLRARAWTVVSMIVTAAAGLFSNDTLSMGMTVSAADAATPSMRFEDGWGTLKGKILLEGDIPEVEPLEITRDEEVCGTFGLRDESFQVDSTTRGIGHVMIWLESREPVPVHPQLEQDRKSEFELDNRDCRFEPHSIVVRSGATVLFRNSDPLAHNVAIAVRRNQPFSEIVPVTGPLKKTFAKAETMPIQVSCSIHAWMRAWMLILDHPYAVITNKDGEFELKNVPAGKWKFRFWHERSLWMKDLNSDGKRTALEKGAWEITIPADGETDLGTLEAPLPQFKPNKK